MNLSCLYSTQAVVLAASFLVSASPAWTLSASASELVQGAMIMAPVREVDVVAADATEDTLTACLARIPFNTTVEQRLLAETTCAHEETARNRSLPNF